MATITVGTNSWVTIAEADIYFESRYGASAWAGLSTANKTSLLITAYNWINSQIQFTIAASATAAVVKNAQCESAWYIYSYWTEHEDRRALYTQGVREFDISKFSEKLELPEFPAWISDMLDGYLTDAGGTFPLYNRDFE